MKISALEEYGLRCLLRLGRAGDGGSLTINEIAETEGLTVANVRKLMMILREADLVQSVRGRSGGYALKGNPREITVGLVMEKLGGRMYDDSFCGKHTGDLLLCINSSACSVRSLWSVIDGMVAGVLHKIHLSDLLGTDGSVTLNLRGHMESTIEELLGPPRVVASGKSLPVIGN
jgi:Rrf2 family protein